MNKPIAPEVIALQSDIFAGKLRLGDVLKEAKVHPATWARWAKGSDPKTSTLAAVRSAVSKLREENA